MEEKPEQNINNEVKATQETVTAIKNSEFMKETIKQRPVNKRKLLRRLIITIAMAVIFGLVACITFLLLEPVINKKINPETAEVTSKVTFVEETAEEETLPEDMIADESELNKPNEEPIVLGDEQIEQVLNEMELGVSDYISMSSSLTEFSRTLETSLVTVIRTTEDVDLFEDRYENENITTGVIVADNGVDILILTELQDIDPEETLEISFGDTKRYSSTNIKTDTRTGLTVISLRKAYLNADTADSITIAGMGTTANRDMRGTPVLALGRPLGNQTSTCIGYITGCESELSVSDADYEILTTDIFGNEESSGVLFNLNGQLVGLIDMSHSEDGVSNVITAYAISGIKNIVERMSNGYDIPYAGINGEDVTEEISEEMGVPTGVYISSLEMDSPALEAGVKSGDIIVGFNSFDISSFNDYTHRLFALEPGSEVVLKVMRQGIDEYTPMEFTFTLSE